MIEIIKCVIGYVLVKRDMAAEYCGGVERV